MKEFEGYDCDGYDCEGYDRDGFDSCGYNIDGVNRLGFDFLELAMNYSERRKEYKNYIEEHINNVQLVWEHLKPLCTGWFDSDTSHLISIDKLVETHDKSKFSEKEFFGYQQWFFPAEGQVKNKDYFYAAWNHHQKFNKHHWEYWVMADGTPLEMDIIYCIEMLCDWGAMSLKFNDTPSDFFNNNKSNMRLHKSTLATIEKWLPIVDKAVETARGEYCIVKGCKNTKKETIFICNICASCYGVLTKGKVQQFDTTFIGDMQRDLEAHKAAIGRIKQYL